MAAPPDHATGAVLRDAFPDDTPTERRPDADTAAPPLTSTPYEPPKPPVASPSSVSAPALVVTSAETDSPPPADALNDDHVDASENATVPEPKDASSVTKPVMPELSLEPTA